MGENMDEYLSIGQIAKLNNVSVQTLRHYEKLGLMSPSYINSDTGYRYYSMKDFITIGLIKQCKAMGLSLNEIKEVIANYTSLESIFAILGNQKELIDNKIKELELIKSKITLLETNIGISLDKGINKVFVKYNDERKCLQFNYTDRNSSKFELDLRKSLIVAEKDYKNANTEIVFTVSYDDMKNNREAIYKNVMLNLGEYVHSEDDKIISIPEGNYLTMYFDDAHRNSYQYYKIIMDYIKKHNIKTKGDFREIYILTRMGKDGVVKSLGKIEILL